MFLRAELAVYFYVFENTKDVTGRYEYLHKVKNSTLYENAACTNLHLTCYRRVRFSVFFFFAGNLKKQSNFVFV